MKIVITRPIPEAGIESLRERYDVHIYESHPDVPLLKEDTLIHLARDANALLTMLSDPVSAAVFASSPTLKVVAQYAVGYDNIDLSAAQSRGIVVTNTPGVLTDATADFAFALLLAVARRVIEADRFVRAGRFNRWETMTLLGVDLRGKTLGIVGMGRIGQAMARRALGFGMEVIYHNRRRIESEVEEVLLARYVTIDELLVRSDFVSLHCPLNQESRHRFNQEAFKRMKSEAILINTARGAVVDEEALVHALDSGEILGAGLDVFEDEPSIHPGLFAHERVVLAPHIASAAIETRTKMAQMCSESVIAVLTGAEHIPHRVV